MRKFGEIDGTVPGDLFENRAALAKAGIHKPRQAGISGSQSEGADSIVLSGGYEDDEDFGDVIIYTGAGGQDQNGKQIADQVLERVNKALALNQLERLPVRVTRGHQHKHPQSPDSGYKYGGLYFVEDHWHEVGLSGFVVWRYRLITADVFQQPQPAIKNDDEASPKRIESITQRLVRNSALARKVKVYYQYKCQVCDVSLETLAGLYAEAAHIQPIGRPHNGPDIESNLICLCPNHHVLFDNGGFTINDDFSLNKIEGKLATIAKHTIDLKFIQYHRHHYS